MSQCANDDGGDDGVVVVFSDLNCTNHHRSCWHSIDFWDDRPVNDGKMVHCHVNYSN